MMKSLMKLVMFGTLGLVSFVGALAGALAVTGNLSRETLDKVMGKEVALEEEAVPPDQLGPLARDLNQLREQLEQQRAAQVEQEQRLKDREDALQVEGQRLDALVVQINADLDQKAALRETRLTTIATSVNKMKPKEAARALESLPEDEAAEILRNDSIAKNAGKIMSEMDAAILARILQHMRDTE